MRRLNQLSKFSGIFDWISRIFDWLASNWNMLHLIDLDVAFYMHLIWQFDSAHVKCDVKTGSNGLESLKLVQSAIKRYLKEKTLHSCPSCSLGNFTTQKKSIAELHRLHPQISSPKTTRCLSLNHRRKEGLPSLIQATRIELWCMHERDCFRCLFVCYAWMSFRHMTSPCILNKMSKRFRFRYF